MNRHVGASFTLSVVVVVFFAVILYEPDHARTASHPTRTPEPVEASPAPPPTPGVPLIESAATAPTPDPPRTLATSPSHPIEAINSLDQSRVTLPKITTPSSPTRVTPVAHHSVPPEPPAVVQVVSRRQSPPTGRHSAFTQVAEGESLTDVALRVYGTSEATSTLWRANRDIISDRETRLDPGLLLRTP